MTASGSPVKKAWISLGEKAQAMHRAHPFYLLSVYKGHAHRPHPSYLLSVDWKQHSHSQNKVWSKQTAHVDLCCTKEEMWITRSEDAALLSPMLGVDTGLCGCWQILSCWLYPQSPLLFFIYLHWMFNTNNLWRFCKTEVLQESKGKVEDSFTGKANQTLGTNFLSKRLSLDVHISRTLSDRTLSTLCWHI